MDDSIINSIRKAYISLQAKMKSEFNRRVSFGDLFTDRSEIAKSYGFGDGSTCYDNVLILGDVKVGKNTWIGPNCILDGSGGGLVIGNYCSISAGVQIYTHSTVKWATSLGKEPIEIKPTKIGSGVYIGPQTVIQMGVVIGDQVTVGACSFVNKDINSGVSAWGCPARVQKC